MAVIGSLMLLGNKSALCLTISAFDTLDDAALQAMVPGLQSLLDRAGWMWMLSFLPLLPLGFLALSIGLLRDREIPRGEAVFLCVGSAMLANPEIQVINFFASFVLAAGFLPLGLRMLRGRGWGGSRTDAPAGAPSKERNILGQPDSSARPDQHTPLSRTRKESAVLIPGSRLTEPPARARPQFRRFQNLGIRAPLRHPEQ